MVLLRQNRENKLSPTLEPEPYREVEKNESMVIIKNATVQGKMWNVGHKKKFVDPETEKNTTQVGTPTPSVSSFQMDEGLCLLCFYAEFKNFIENI